MDPQAHSASERDLAARSKVSAPDQGEAQAAIHALALDLAQRWLETGDVPDDAVEATAPALRELLGAGMELSFDDFQHKHYVRPDWGFLQYAPPEFPAPFELYIPTTWRIEPTDEPLVAVVRDGDGRRQQVVQIATRKLFPDAVGSALGARQLLGFEVGRDFGQFIRWRFVAETEQGYEVWSIFSAGEFAVVILGEATGVDDLKRQLVASANSIPWHHWIEAARNQ